jgi:O-antigen ligase
VIAFYLLVAVMPMIRHPFWSEFVGDLTPIKYLGLVTVFYAVVRLLGRRAAPRYFATWAARLFVAFALLAITLFVEIGVAVPIEISPLMSYSAFLVLFFVTLTVVDSTPRLRGTLLAAVGGTAYASLHVIREWQKYGGMSAGYRPGYVAGDANYYSLSVLLCAPAALYLLRRDSSPLVRRCCAGALVVMLFGLTLAASRGALLGLIAALLLMAVRSRHRLRTFAGPATVVASLMALVPSSPLLRLLAPTEADAFTAEHRWNLARAGLEMFWAHPWTGVGPGNFKIVLPKFAPLPEIHVAHNTYVSVMAEMGLPGILLFTGLLVSLFVTLERARRSARAGEVRLVETAAEALQVGFTGFLVAALFLSAEVHRFFWLMAFVAMTLPTLAREVERPAATAPVGSRAAAPRQSRVAG